MTHSTRLIRLVPGLAALALITLTRAGAAAAAGYGTLADCVRNSGAVMYSASWCPVCRQQRQEFRGFANRLKTMECSVGGNRKKTRAVCEKMGISGYPTWIFADGSSAGFLSAKDLAARTGCEAPD
jgi:hypothetical protein